METLVTTWPSNVLSLLPLYLLLSSALRILSLSLCVSVFFFVLRPWVLFFLCFSVLVPSLHFFFIPLCASPVFLCSAGLRLSSPPVLLFSSGFSVLSSPLSRAHPFSGFYSLVNAITTNVMFNVNKV
jgi:hypothetical protein